MIDKRCFPCSQWLLIICKDYGHAVGLISSGMPSSTCSRLLYMQLPYFQLLTSWLKTIPELKSVVDTDSIGVAGHSRGAKLAALHFASGKLTILQASPGPLGICQHKTP